MRNKVLDLIKKRPYKFNVRKLANDLKLTGAKDFVALNQLLNSLEEELIIGRDSLDYFFCIQKKDLVEGKIRINSKGNGFVDDEKGFSYYLGDSLMGALDGDKVLVLKDKYSFNEASVVKVVERNTQFVSASLYKGKKKVICKVNNAKLARYSLVIKNLDDYKEEVGNTVVIRISSSSSDKIYGEIVQVVGKSDDSATEISEILISHGVEEGFSESAMLQAESISDTVLPEQKANRKDLTKLLTITIDGDDSKDFDDAVSIEPTKSGYNLYVHIADVAYYVRENTPIDLNARKKGTSTYVCDRVAPMLPFKLSNGICSLNPKVERLALSVRMHITSKGKVSGYKVFPSVIKSDERMTYNKVNKILEGDEELCNQYGYLVNPLRHMYMCSLKLRKEREKLGSIDFEAPEIYVKVDEKGKAIGLDRRHQGTSEKIIEDFMITANRCVANWLLDQKIPGLYRVHEAPEEKKMREWYNLSKVFNHPYRGPIVDVEPKDLQASILQFKEEEAYPVISKMMLRTMQKARYSEACLGHFGLGLEEYLHFTSPIRRYPDLIVHRMLWKYCFSGKRPVDSSSDVALMKELAMETSACERKAIACERDVTDMKVAEFMESEVGKVYDGVISSVTSFGFFVELENLAEGLVGMQSLRDDYYEYDEVNFCIKGMRFNKRYKLGDKVRIKVKHADHKQQHVDFELVGEKRSSYGRKGNRRKS